MRSVLPRILLGALFLATPLRAQDQQPPASATPPEATQEAGIIRFRLPTITVTPQKEREDLLDSPVSVTAVTADTLGAGGARTVSEAAQYAPNVFFNEFTARKVSNPRFRGVGASPSNPGVVTYIDGVPQLQASSSSIELAGVDQIEFVRGPQSALFGRNALGGVVNITSTRPSLRNWNGSINAPIGNFSWGDLRGDVAGPLVADRLSLGIAGGFSERDGFTKNDVTGRDLDSRSAAFGKIQLLWTPAANWEIRGILNGERARDGDYALGDVAALRADPFHVSRDFEGFTHRDLVAPTAIVTRAGRVVDFSSTTGFVSWKTRDVTDLDYSALPLFTRDNKEKDRQFTQELRFSSARNTAIAVSRGVSLRWQGGLFFFTQSYTQDAVNRFAPFVLSEFVTFPVDQHSPESALDDRGVGAYGEGTLTFGGKLDTTIAVRLDRENKKAQLNTFFSPEIFAPSVVAPERDFTAVSPQFTAAYRAAPGRTIYVTAARGFMAGGFNPASPPGSEAYDEEHNWNYEAGVKSSWLGQRLSVNAGVFYLRWRDLQVNLPNPFVPQQFYIANAGKAVSRGLEVEVNAAPAGGLELFSGVGFTNARFGDGSVSGGVDVGGNKLSNTPDYTASAGVQYSREVGGAATLFARGELVGYGQFHYDDANTEGQGAYSLTNLRAGVRVKGVLVEGWMRNAFDTRYIPIAFAGPGLSPSGFIGENGAPRTFGIRAGWSF